MLFVIDSSFLPPLHCIIEMKVGNTKKYSTGGTALKNALRNFIYIYIIYVKEPRGDTKI